MMRAHNKPSHQDLPRLTFINFFPIDSLLKFKKTKQTTNRYWLPGMQEPDLKVVPALQIQHPFRQIAFFSFAQGNLSCSQRPKAVSSAKKQMVIS